MALRQLRQMALTPGMVVLKRKAPAVPNPAVANKVQTPEVVEHQILILAEVLQQMQMPALD